MFDRLFGVAVLRLDVFFIALPLVVACRTELSRRGIQPADAQQVVGGAGEIRQQLGPLDAPDAGLAQAAHGLHPAEDFFDALAFSLAQDVALVPGGAGIEARGLSTVDPGDVRDDATAAQARDEVLGVVTLVRPEGLGLDAFAPLAREHLKGRLAFGVAVGGSDVDIEAQAVAVFHEGVAREGESGLLAGALLRQPGLGIRGAFVGGVGTHFPVEIDARVARVIGRRCFLLRFGLEALQRGPGLDERPVHREVLVGQEIFGAGETHHGIEERQGHVVRHQALTVFAEGAGVEGFLFQAHVEEPTKQDVVTELLAEEPVGADRIQRDQQARLQQPLRRDGRAAGVAVHRLEGGGERLQRLVRVVFDGAQRMVRRHACFGREIAEHVSLGIQFTAHALTPLIEPSYFIAVRKHHEEGFSATC